MRLRDKEGTAADFLMSVVSALFNFEVSKLLIKGGDSFQ